MRVHAGDNLVTLQRLASEGAKFDLVELDGPYMAGLEGWDTLTEEQYIDHYAARLTLVRQLLNPWGAVFVFGYPEGCAEIKSWAHRTGTLWLRRWITWYKQVTAHKGRKVESILFFLRGNPAEENLQLFGRFLREQRLARSWTLADVQRAAQQLGAERPWWSRGGNLYYETASGGAPTPDDLALLARIFQFDADSWAHVVRGSFEGITDLDCISKTYPEDTDKLNDNGLRSKPVGLYLDLFRPVIPTQGPGRALILYGGSGNAAVAAEALGYDVDLCEFDERRTAAIESRHASRVQKWTGRVRAMRAQRSLLETTQLDLFS